MKTLSIALLAAAVFVLTPAARAQAPQTYFVFKASVTIPTTVLVVGNDFDKLVKKTFTSADLVNLALGRKPGTKIATNGSETLALATYFKEDALLSKLVIYDKTAMGTARFKAIVAQLDSVDIVNAYTSTRNTGLGLGTGKFVATTLGDPAKYGLLQTTFTGSAIGSGGHATIPSQANGFQQKPTTVSGTVTFQGHLKFNTTDASNVTTVYDGIFNHAVGIGGGKLLDTVDY